MTAINIRHAQPADAANIAVLYAQLVNNTAMSVLPERITQVAADPDTVLFVGEKDGHLCATALVSLCADVMFGTQPFAVVENIVVDLVYRGSGVGSLLFRHIERYCVAAECSKIMLLSAGDRNQAHRFFERAGFAGSAKRGFVKYRRNFTDSAPDQVGN